MKKLLVILILLTTSAWGYTVYPTVSTSDAPDSVTVYWYVNSALDDSIKSTNPAGGGEWELTQRYWDTTWAQTDNCVRCWLMYRVYYAGYTDIVTEYIDQGLADTLWAVLDSLQSQDGWIASATILGNVRDTVNGIMDSVQLHDNWVAKEATLTTMTTTLGNARDSINAILDTLQVWDDDVALLVAMRDSINGIIDSLQSQDGWVMAKTDSVTVDMSNLNTTIDDDTTLVTFLRAGIGTASNAEVLDSLGKILDSVYAGATLADIVHEFLTNDSFWDSVANRSDSGGGGVATVDTMSIWRQVWRTLPTGFADSTGYIAQLLHDTVMALMDSIQNQDNWIMAKTDSVIVDVSAALASNNLVGKIAAHSADSIWNEDTTGHMNGVPASGPVTMGWVAHNIRAINANGDTIARLKDSAAFQGSASGLTAEAVAHQVWGHDADTAWAAGSMGDSALGWGATAASSFNPATDSVIVKMGSFNTALDNDTTLVAYLRSLVSLGVVIKDTVNGTLDTLQLYDGRWALATIQTNIRDSVNAILDSLQLWDDDIALLAVIRDTVNGIMDTVQLYDGRWSTLTASDNIGINWGDVSNPTTTLGLTGTTIGTVTTTGTATNVTTVNGLAANVITAASIATDAIDSTEIAAGAILASEIGTGAIDADAIANSAIDFDAVAVNTFSGSKFLDSYWDSIATRSDSGAAGGDSTRLYTVDKQILAGITADSVLQDSGAYQGSASGLDSATVYGAMAQIVTDSSLAGGGTGCSGTGVDTVNILALDTTGTDTALYLAKIVVKTMAGVVEGNLFTESGGQALFTLTTGDTFTVWGYKGGYVFDIDTIVVAAGMTDTANAYNAIIGTPSSADLCRVYAWAYDPQGNPIEGGLITATLQGNRVQDTCNNTVLVNYTQTGSPSDATGYLYLDLTKSKCLDGQQKYQFYITYPSGETINVGKQSVPDSSTYMLTW